MPKANSTRVIAMFWWLFCLISISSYTANLAAFLTKNKMSLKINGAGDLVKQNKVNYGCFQGGSTRNFFRMSNITTFSKINTYMEEKNEMYNMQEDNATKAINRVLNGSYAYFMESPPLRYELTKNCELIEIGKELNSLMYSLALPKDSIYTRQISDAILLLRERQDILQLTNKWWRVGNSSMCGSSKAADAVNSNQLQLANFAGVFVILGCLIGLALIILIIEFCVGSYQSSIRNKTSFCRELAYDCAFSVRCCDNDEKLRKRHVSTGDLQHSDSDYLERPLDRLSLSLDSLTASLAAAPSERATLLSRSLPASRYDSFRKVSGGGSTTPRLEELSQSDYSLDTTRDTNTTVINAPTASQERDDLSTTITSTAL